MEISIVDLMGFYGMLWDFMGFHWIYPLVMTNISMENHHRNSGCFPLNIVMFHSYVKLLEGINDATKNTPRIVSGKSWINPRMSWTSVQRQIININHGVPSHVSVPEGLIWIP